MKAGQDTPRFLRAIGLLFAGRQKEPSDLELEAYWETLECFDVDLVERVMKKLRKRPGGFAASEGDIYDACFAAKPDPNAPKALPAMPAREWTEQEKRESRDLISRLRGGPLPTLMESFSGLPEAERAEARPPSPKHEERRR